jgi:hypothetical protein
MVMIAIGSALIGAVFGIRFAVLVLFPIYSVFALATGATFLLDFISAKMAMWAFITHAVSAQLGYLSGLSIRHFQAVSRLPSRSPKSNRSPSPKSASLVFPTDS